MSPGPLGIICALAVMLVLLFVCLVDAFRRIHRLTVTLREQNAHYKSRENVLQNIIQRLEGQQAQRLDAMQERGIANADEELARLFGDGDNAVAIEPEPAPKKKARKGRSVWQRIRKPEL